MKTSYLVDKEIEINSGASINRLSRLLPDGSVNIESVLPWEVRT